MATNPLQHYNVFNEGVVEPAVSGLIELEANEPLSPSLVNDLVILSPFRSGKPLSLRRHRSFASVQHLHDPDSNGDQGVELARVAKSAFSDPDVFGAAQIITCRVDPSTNARCTLTDGVNDVIRIERTDYGSHTNGPGVTFGAASVVGKKIVLTDTVRQFIGDNLGILLTGLQYTGNGSAASLTVVTAIGRIAYSGQPADGTNLSINGITFEFDSNANTGVGTVPVTIGASAAASFAALAAAITANVPGVQAIHDEDDSFITVTAFETGVVMQENADPSAVITLTHLPPAARLKITLTNATDGSQSLDIPLTVSQFQSIDRLASYINSQFGYTCAVSPYANKFLASSGLDIVAGVNVKAAPVFLTGYVAATVDFVNTKTRGQYLATELARQEPVDQTVTFQSGATANVNAAAWQNALDLVGAELERGGILLPDTDDPAIFAMIAAFIEEQRQHGKWFRAFFGGRPGQVNGADIAAYDTIAAATDSERCRLVVQRLARFRPDQQSIDYLHPVFFAAALAGGAAGNLPFARPLTNKRMRFAGVHPDDAFTGEIRTALLEAGITVAKQEQDRLVVSLAVTTSRDPQRRMARIMSEIDTVDLIDSAVREAFLPFRGQWADRYIVGRVKGTLTQVLQRFVDQGALVAGQSAEGEFIPAWRFSSDPPFTIQAGVVTLHYQIYIGSEIDFIDLYGRAAYQRLVGEIGGGSLLDRSVPVPA